MSPDAEERPDLAAAIAALRGRGVQRVDPIRFRQAEAMARRAPAHHGEARRLLDQKLAQLLAGLEQSLDACVSKATAVGPTPPASPLGDLLAGLARQTLAGAEPGAGDNPTGGSPSAPPRMELKAVREHRSTWARLGVDQRLRQSLATVPDKAGPLNTQRLMHQALTAMRDASPAYLQRLITQVEALLWLDQASLPLATAQKKDTARNPRQR
jgi:hypothetical protein